jgi:type IX secretion system PorP/SprF family membrane protein
MRLRYLLFSILFSFSLLAQDPHFTQFFSAPFTINPAYTGVFDGRLRVMTNYRQQWANFVTPFTTAVIAGDVKVGSLQGVSTQQPINIGMQLMQDQSMGGAFRSSFAGLLASYHVNVDAVGDRSLGVGLSFNYGNRIMDFSSLSFDRQFASNGFNLSLPNGEAAMQNMKPFYSIGAGLLYRYASPLNGTFFDIGLSGYHFNKPVQTIFDDPLRILPVRWSAQVTVQQYVGDVSLINIKAIYQKQASIEYVLTGLSMARSFGDENQFLVGTGFWYRLGESVAPYAFCEVSGLKIGFSYDVTNITKQPLAPASSLELSLQWRIKGRHGDVLRCKPIF